MLHAPANMALFIRAIEIEMMENQNYDASYFIWSSKSHCLPYGGEFEIYYIVIIWNYNYRHLLHAIIVVE